MKNIDIKKIIIALIILIAGGILIFYFFLSDKNNNSLNELTTFFPFEEGGANGTTQDNPVNTNPTTKIDPITGSLPILRKISETPVAGAIIFKDTYKEENEETNYIIRYIERATGHIYETSTTSFTLNRISNTTIPKIQEVIWLDKDSLIIRYLEDDDTIKTFSAQLITDNLGEKELEGVYLQDNIKSIIKLGEKIFYLLDNGKGSIGVKSDKDDKNREIIFDSPLKEWLITSVGDEYINFTTKPAITTYGFSFLFDTKTKEFKKVINKKMNLSTLMNNSFDILYSEYGKTNPKLSLFINENKINTDISIKTFPEKCVWNKENIYCGIPEGNLENYDLTKWYQGLISFSDEIWKINKETTTTEFLISPTEFDTNGLDIINPILDEDGNYLVFMNKKDLSLWVLKLFKY